MLATVRSHERKRPIRYCPSNSIQPWDNYLRLFVLKFLYFLNYWKVCNTSAKFSVGIFTCCYNMPCQWCCSKKAIKGRQILRYLYNLPRKAELNRIEKCKKLQKSIIDTWLFGNGRFFPAGFGSIGEVNKQNGYNNVQLLQEVRLLRWSSLFICKSVPPWECCNTRNSPRSHLLPGSWK